MKGQAEGLQHLAILIEHGARNAQVGVQSRGDLMRSGLDLVNEHEEALQTSGILVWRYELRHRASQKQMVGVPHGPERLG